MERMVDRTISAAAFTDTAHDPLPSRARIVIVGGGVVGTSIAHHLSEAGERDVLLLEANVLGSGTTWHAAGLVNSARASTTLTQLSKYSRDCYVNLGKLADVDLNWVECGSLSMARTEGRVDELQYQLNVAQQGGIEARFLNENQLSEQWPLVNPAGVKAALLIPGDGTINPGYAAIAFARLAHASGVQIRERARVDAIIVRNGRAVGVHTAMGDVEADVVVLAAGLWTRDLARAANVSVPLYAAEHVHVRTNPVEASVPTLPILRDLDASYYIRHEEGRFLVGAFEPDGKPVAVKDISSGGFAEFDPDWAHFDAVRIRSESTVPAIQKAGFERFINAPESFTPDANFVLGETGEVDGLFVAAGMNSQGIIFAPGIGRELAAWILTGTPQFDASAVDARRFSHHQDNRRYLHDRTREGLGRLYAMHWPNLQMSTGRNVRRSPLHHRVEALGAVFGEINGGERANWYDSSRAPVEYSYRRASWFEHVAAEHRAARENVVLFDLSPFAKVLIDGPDALDVVQRTFTSDLDVPLNRAVYTLQLNEAGGIELDVTVTRLEENRFLVVAPSATRDKTLSILRRAAAGTTASIFDATSAYATISVNGPNARRLLENASPEDWSDEAQPYLAGRWVEIAEGYAYALRVSFTGELGYEIYVSSDLAENVYDALWEAGQEFGVKPAGYFALDSLRCEKGFRHLGHDIGPIDDPRSSGLWFTVSLNKEADFIGRAAISGDLTRKHRVVYVNVADPEPVLLHDETLYRDGTPVGRVTSGNYGHSLGAAVGLAVIAPDAPLDGTWEVEVGAARYSAEVSPKPFYDPTGSRTRS